MASHPLLEISAVSKSFGGVKAVDSVTFAVRAGQIHSLIGPNGAGKTTLFNIVTGLYVPDSGQVRLDGRDVTGAPPRELARLGVSRTFQNLQVCGEMSLIENVMLGQHLRLDARVLAGMWRSGRLRERDRVSAAECARLLDFVGIARFADETAQSMSFGVLKRLEIARALAARPRLLLLDEPAAGLNGSEKREVSRLLREVASEVTLLLVEHDMAMVMSLSDYITVLSNGSRIAEGDAATVRASPAVIAAYLGAGAEAVHA